MVRVRFRVLSVAAWMAAVGCMVLVLSSAGCNRSSQGDGINVKGSDTMVNLAQAWQEEYEKEHPEAGISVSGGGSGVGISGLINGTCNMANASRKMKEKELKLAQKKHGKEPQEFIVGYDALAVYVHKDNPMDSISIDQLAEIYGEGGEITKWSQLGIDNPAGDEIVRVSRQNNSGTYAYFREAVVGKKRDYKLGSIDQSGSKDVVELVSKTPCAIGYSGMGYATEGVKMLKIAKSKDAPPIAPTLENAQATDESKRYPITRPLHIYTLGEPDGKIKKYIDWILSSKGQDVVKKLGYVPAGSDT